MIRLIVGNFCLLEGSCGPKSVWPRQAQCRTDDDVVAANRRDDVATAVSRSGQIRLFEQRYQRRSARMSQHAVPDRGGADDHGRTDVVCVCVSEGERYEGESLVA